ncbi:uncharacterized protein LOC143287147 [Babylonia areolata]|uniref:uncharacterized protein LOC143287147 n=1 Tax=Babylonia areolata TaxID=304850 RepID=UPI003FCFD72B
MASLRDHSCSRRTSLPVLVVVTAAAVLTSCCGVIVSAGDVRSRSPSLHKPSKGLGKVNLTEWGVGIVRQQFNVTLPGPPATISGLFPSEVRVNFRGESSVAALRDSQWVPDLTSLSTLLTLGVMVEAAVKAPVDRMPTARVVQTLESLGAFRSPSFGENRSALMTFWPVQTKGAPNTWTSRSLNAVKGGVSLNPVSLMQKAVADCKDQCPLASQGLQEIRNDKVCLQYFNQSLSDYAKRHNYPPDVTSSFANLALGALLHMGGDGFSSAHDVWRSKNANMTHLVDHASRFAYQPLSSEASNNVIDSRAYYVIQEYLSQQGSNASENVSLVTCWIPQTAPGGRVQFGDGALPTYNTIDLFATSTFLYALTNAVLHKLIDYSDTARTLLVSNLDLITWIVSNKRKDDLDLLMTSHPSTFQFYWMLSRSMFELEKARVQGMDTYQFFQDVYSAWNKTVRQHVTEAILKGIRDGGLDGGGKPLTYVDGILSPAPGQDGNGQQPPMGNDRLFTTASAANSLLAAWTVHNKQGQLLFLPGTPVDVALATKGLVNYVISKYKEASLMNVLHSTLYKHCQSIPCYFPFNSAVMRNGTVFNGSLPTPDVLFGMRGGPVTPEEYSAMLGEPRYGHRTSADALPEVDSAAAPFFFWSVPVYTQAMCLLAAGQMKNLQGEASSIEELMGSFQPSSQPVICLYLIN